ncbi:aminotransferase class V-fold PLP-dependent enzyme [Streptomyces avidinii]|uniref:aminotransferase class V-fold PLP-dependent enzyme n=1 Tax=Streptomyces avidinii TaxID=1895 RepID=UPI003870E52F|nr:aminotransferase class V-fold PLP-dependent enzyme [Streptomyces avidinii]WST49948.1 aminotransferase class V-fold PLP-dependent enzyme [Streptomyces avidinii]
MNAPTHHGERTAHLNTAGTGRMPDAVHAVLARCTALDDRYGPAALRESPGAMTHPGLHARLAALLGVRSGRTVLTTGAAQAFEAFARTTVLGPRDRIWTTPHEGVANLTALHALRERTRCRLEVVPLRPDGDLDLDWMRTHLDEDVALVSAVHLSAACGTVNPVEDIGRLLAPHRARYTLDASHSVGLLPVDAARIGCQLLTADGWRFLRGPQDIGFAHLAPDPRTDPHDGPHDGPRDPYDGPYDGLAEGLAEGAVRAPAPAAVAALGAALDHHTAAARRPHQDLLPLLRDAVRDTPGMELLAAGRQQAGVLAFRHAEIPAAAIRRGLARRGVVLAKTVAHEHPLHPAGRITAPALRACVHHDNTPQDIDRLRRALTEVLREEHAAAVPVPARAALAAAGPAAAADPGPPPSPYRTARPARRRGHLTLHRAN